MRKFVCLATLLSCGLTLYPALFVSATQSMVSSPNVPTSAKKKEEPKDPASNPHTEVKKGGAIDSEKGGTTDPDKLSAAIETKKGEGQAATTNTQKESEDSSDDQGQMPAWMLETAQVAKEYVTAIDNGQYAQSWTKGDQLFQHTISQDEWTKALNAGRKGLGRAVSRQVLLQRPAWNPKGLPKGPYMVIEYETSFEKAPNAKELLTLRRGTDGKWRVLTYQVQ